MDRCLGEPPYDDSEFPIEEAYPLMDAVAAHEGWDDPEMDGYNDPSRGEP